MTVSPLLQALYERRFDDARRLREQAESLDPFEAAALGEDPGEVDLAARSPDGFTMLHLAAFFGHGELVRRLLERGADPGAVAENPIRVQPLHSAVAARDETGARALLAAGADPDARQVGGVTPLHAAALHGMDGIVDALLAVGADPGLPDDAGTTPAEYARRGRHEALARRLSG